jgi:hypothetical protein
MRGSGKALLAALAGGVLVAATAAFASDETADEPRAGEEVRRICFGRDINNFRTIEGEDDAVLLEKGVNDWYKVTLVGACSYRDIKWAQSVAIEQRPAGGCVTSGDYLVFSRSAFGDFSFPNATRCAISEIYKWDPDAAEEEEVVEPSPED